MFVGKKDVFSPIFMLSKKYLFICYEIKYRLFNLKIKAKYLKRWKLNEMKSE